MTDQVEIIPPPLSRMKRQHRYPDLGRCAYCGAGLKDTALTDEHVIPLSLGGGLILPVASCKACQDITGAFEGHNAGRLFRPIRRQFKFPSRRRGRKQREERAKETFVVKVNGKKLNIPADEYPGLLVTFVFPAPTLLLGMAPTNESFTGRIGISTLPDFGERLNRLRAKYSDQVEFPTYGSSEVVGRLLAKIAHTYAVAELGPDAFRPYLLGIIRGQDAGLMRHLIGSAAGAEPARGDLHEIEILPANALDTGKLVIVKIRLFSNSPGVATHYVVAGEMKG